MKERFYLVVDKPFLERTSFGSEENKAEAE